MESATCISYSMAFKQQVVGELEAGRFRSIHEASEHYGVAGSSTVRNWLRRLGRNHLIPKVVRVEKPDEANEIVELKKQIRRLQQALGQTQLKNVLNETLFEMACQELGVDAETFKKKADMKLSTGPDRPAGSR